MRGLILRIALLAGLAVAMPTAAEASIASKCPARGAHVLVQDAHSAVYWFPRRGPEGYEEGSAVYACTRGHRAVPVREVLAYGDNAGFYEVWVQLTQGPSIGTSPAAPASPAVARKARASR